MSLRERLREKQEEAQSEEITSSQISKLTTNKLNDKVDTKFSQMHSHFILLKEKENKLNYEFKKEVLFKQKFENMPEHILDKYVSGGQTQTSFSKSKSNLGNRSFQNQPQEKSNFKSAFKDKIHDVLVKSKVKKQQGDVNQQFTENNETTFKELSGVNDKSGKEYIEQNMGDSVQMKEQEMMGRPKGVNQSNMEGRTNSGLKNMSMNKIHNRFNKMITEFDNIEVNQSYLENGFQNMKMNFGDIHSQKGGYSAGIV
jgi:hypothetical protein